jgi:hypothetical protein
MAITSLLVSSAFLVACSSDSGEADNSGGQSSTPSGTAGSAAVESGGSGGKTAATGGSSVNGGTPEPAPTGGLGGSTGGLGGSTGGVSEPAASGGASEATGGAGQPPEPPPPTDVPVIDSLTAAIDDDGDIAVEFEGRVGIAQVRRIWIELLDAAGNQVALESGWGSWHVRPNRFFPVGSSGHLEQSGARFTGFMSFHDSGLSERPERVRVTIEDLEESPGEPAEATLSAPSPVPRAEGEICDPFEVLNRCEGAALCDTIDSNERVAPTCQTPDEICPKALLELEDSLQASNADSIDDTYSSCTNSRGQLGNDQGHVFVASRAGAHRFRAEEIDYQVAVTLFARRICNLGIAGDSELGCVHMNDFEMGEPLELVLELEAGQTVFVYVEASWVGGGEYVLSVEEPS